MACNNLGWKIGKFWPQMQYGSRADLVNVLLLYILDFGVAESLLSSSIPRKIIKESSWFYWGSGLDE